MDFIQTIIIAIVEGLTEFLPVSSTGHMIITQNLLGVPKGDPFVHAFTFIIQFGAILSVVCLYWKQFFQMRTKEELQAKLKFYGLLIVGVFPAVVVGLLAKKSGLLDWLLDSVTVVAITLVLGGVFMLFCDRLFNTTEKTEDVNWKRAFKIGCFQCLSEFSFFLAVPTMAGATLLDLLEMFKEGTNWATTTNIKLLLLGCIIAFLVAIFAMKWFVAFLAKYGFKAFGWYRIIVGLVILVLLATGHSLTMID